MLSHQYNKEDSRYDGSQTRHLEFFFSIHIYLFRKMEEIKY